jgi:hypothetical protein
VDKEVPNPVLEQGKEMFRGFLFEPNLVLLMRGFNGLAATDQRSDISTVQRPAEFFEDSLAALSIRHGNQLTLAGVKRHGKTETAALAWRTRAGSA